MKHELYESTSRRTTPWTGLEDASPMQIFIDGVVEKAYESKHQKVSETHEEVELLNSYKPEVCPHCGSSRFIRYGKTSTGTYKYKCKDCGKYFSITTGTIFQDHKIPLTEWIEYCLCLFRYQSFNSISKTNRNSFTTTKYWLSKICLLLEHYQDDIVLEGNVYIDETFIRVRKEDIIYKEGNKQLRGISPNQMCIGIGCDDKHVIAIFQGYSKPSKGRTKACFESHIKKHSKLIHDQDSSHDILVEDLELESEVHNSKLLKGLPDSENPLDPINRQCDLLQSFLKAHSSFIRDDLQDYLNLFAFIMNSAYNPYEKVEILLNQALHFPKTLTFREKYSK